MLHDNDEKKKGSKEISGRVKNNTLMLVISKKRWENVCRCAAEMIIHLLSELEGTAFACLENTTFYE